MQINTEQEEKSLEDLRARYSKMAIGEKMTDDWGVMKAKALWNAGFARSDIDLKGLSFFDFGCSWGYFGRYLLKEAGLGSYTGVDIVPMWETAATDWDWAGDERVRLFAGDACAIPELQNDQYDVIFTYGTLFTIPPEALKRYLEWFYARLKPGGRLVAATHTHSSWCGGGLMRDISAPGAHMLFSRSVLDDFLKERGISLRETPANSPLTVGSYLTLYKRVGFEIDLARHSANRLEGALSVHAGDKLNAFTPSDRKTSVVTTFMTKPPRSEETAPVDIKRLKDLNAEAPGPRKFFKLFSSKSAKTVPSGEDSLYTGAWERTSKWAERHADAVAALLDQWKINVAKQSVLQIGCTFGSVGRKLSETAGIERYVGVDASPIWQDPAAAALQSDSAKVTLHAGAIDTIDDLADEKFDIALLVHCLESLSPEEIEKTLGSVYDRLKPGGRALVVITPWTGRNGAGLENIIDAPFAHLLFSETVLQDYVSEKFGQSPPQRNSLTAGTYLGLCMRVGFEVIDAKRVKTERSEKFKTQFKKELAYLPEDELETDVIEIVLTRPWEKADLLPPAS